MQRAGSGIVCGERTARRRGRVERRLQERMEPVAAPTADELHHNILEFVETHFNQHPRSPEGFIFL